MKKDTPDDLEKLDDTQKTNAKEIKKSIKKLNTQQMTTRQRIKTNQKRNTILIGGFGGVILAFVMLDYSQTGHDDPLSDGFIIENLRGDTVDIWAAWIIPAESRLHVNVLNSELISDEKKSILKNVVLSHESVDVDNSLLHKGPKGTTSTYYIGWRGALENAATHQTKYHIPTTFEFVEESPIAGDIVIKFTKSQSGDGYSGFTKLTVDDAKNQILKATITIYEADTLSNEEFESILRHELGHAFGLAHSSAPEDLMYPTLPDQYPLISECNIDAIIALYDDKKTNKVVCDI